MPRFAVALIASAMGIAPQVAIADGPPNLDVSISCQTAGRGSIVVGRDMQACLNDEQTARDILTKDWNAYSERNRKICVDENRSGGPPSYVELLSCIEVMTEAAKLATDPLIQPVPMSTIETVPRR